MSRCQNSRSCYWTGCVFILLLVGSEAARMKYTADTSSVSSMKQRARKMAATEQRVRRDFNEQNKSQMEHAADVVQGLHLEVDPNEDVEVARGWLHYNNKDVYAILRKLESESGKGRLDLYMPSKIGALSGADEKFMNGDQPLSKPFRSMIIRADDAILMDQRPGGDVVALTGEKHYWTHWATMGNMGSPSRKTMMISAVAGRHSLRMLGDEKWLDTGSADNVMKAWLNVFRTLQTVGGTCLEQGTCLVQCTYLAHTGGCNSDFCTLEQRKDETGWMKSFFAKSRPRCFPREGVAASLEGWQELKRNTHASADYIESTGCVANCESSWELVSTNIKMSNELSRQFAAMEGEEHDISHFKISADLRTILQTIKEEGVQFSEEVADKLGKGFDWSKKSSFSPLGNALAKKGCANLPDGAMQALFRIDAAPADQMASAQAEFSTYTEACSWFKSLANSPDEMVEDNEELQQAKKTGLVHANSSLGNSSLLERGQEEYLPVFEIIAIAAIIASCVTILAGIAIIIRGSMCSKAPGPTTASVAHQHCKTYLQTGGPCWQSHMLPGIYIMTGGFVMLAFTGLAVWAVMGGGAALIPGMWEVGVASVAKAGGLATMGAMVVKIKSWFKGDPNSTSEDKYTQCMSRLDGVVPDGMAAIAPPTATIVGLDALMAKTHIREDHKDDFRMDLLGLGVYDVEELTSDDYKSLASWKLLTKFEQRRLIQAATPE